MIATNVYKQFSGQLHVACDGWTLPNRLSFVAIIVHFADADRVRHLLLNIVEVPHVGPTAGHSQMLTF